jgi:hypothetical protein
VEIKLRKRFERDLTRTLQEMQDLAALGRLPQESFCFRVRIKTYWPGWQETETDHEGSLEDAIAAATAQFREINGGRSLDSRYYTVKLVLPHGSLIEISALRWRNFVPPVSAR